MHNVAISTAALGILAPGTRVGDYVVTRFLSSGGFGAVYAVEDPTRGRRAALKLLHAELCALGDPLARFLREAQVLDVLHHPNVVELYGSGSLPDGRAYLVTELLDGVDLEEHVERVGALSVENTLAILAPICGALDTAHANHIIHRDIKASNVFLAGRGEQTRVVLLDFGLAKVLEQGAQELLSSRLALGTPGSMSPEQLRAGVVDPRTDVYGLGALAYQLVTGRLPFAEVAHTARAYMHLNGARPRAAQHGRIPAAIDAVIGRAMAQRPDDRYRTAGAFLAAFRAAATDRTPLPVSSPLGADEIGVYLDVRLATPADSRDAELDAIDAAMLRAEQIMLRHGFSVALERGSAMLFIARGGDAQAIASQLRAANRGAAEVRTGDGQAIAVTIHRGTNVRHVDQWIVASPTGAVVVTAAAAAPRAPHQDSQAGSHTQMMALIGRRTAGIVHDMRSPISVVLSNTELLLEDLAAGVPFTDEHRSMLLDIRAAGLILKTDVNDVLTSSAVDHHRSERIPVCVPEIIECAIKLTDSKVRGRVSVCHDDSSYVLGAQGQLVQVLTNLIVNASDAMGECGQITIRTGSSSAGEVEISVHDTGPGIPVEVADRVFEPFFTTKAPGSGTGLGLSLVRDIVEEHGGVIRVSSSAGMGTRFTIRLPIAHATA